MPATSTEVHAPGGKAGNNLSGTFSRKLASQDYMSDE